MELRIGKAPLTLKLHKGIVLNDAMNENIVAMIIQRYSPS